MKSIVIAGAGVIGLATALELAEHGHRVTVLERGRAHEQASWAAAGMLAGGDPENPAELSELSRLSQRLYPDFLTHLESLSGFRVPLHTQHTLQLIDERIKTSGAIRAISRTEAIERVPGVTFPAHHVALWLDERSIDPRELCRALAGAVRAREVEIREDSPVLTVAAEGSQLAVRTSCERADNTFIADDLVVATGAWAAPASTDSASGTLAGTLHLLPGGSIVPRKGQMLRVRPPRGVHLNAVLRAADVYIVPRQDGSLIIGATVEDAGFDRTVRGEATAWLLEEAARLWEPISGVRSEHIEEVWTGIRPGTPDRLPVLGRLRHPHVWFATGHFRNGILLAPASARVIREMVCGEAVAVDTGPFDPGRFGNASCADAEIYATMTTG